jgi:putative SOS response-associated peptidase YedK
MDSTNGGRGEGQSPDAHCDEDRELFTFAGLWDIWRGDPEADPLYTFTIITTDANVLLRPIHHRMPLIIDRLVTNHWLQPGPLSSTALSILLAAVSIRADGSLRGLKTRERSPQRFSRLYHAG